MASMKIVLASPKKGSLFDFLELDVDMTSNTPASSALQHLVSCITQPAWLAEEARLSGTLHDLYHFPNIP
jgi:hypothetical protein